MLFIPSAVRFSLGCDSSILKDQKNTMAANKGGVRKTIRHEAMDKIAIPKKGAKTGVERKTVKISDMMRAIRSPLNRSRTPAIVVIKTAEAPMPAMKRAA